MPSLDKSASYNLVKLLFSTSFAGFNWVNPHAYANKRPKGGELTHAIYPDLFI
jgi:hypothetical protein